MSGDRPARGGRLIPLPDIPHRGRMSLLAGVEAWTAEGIRCRALSHLAVDNPLRRHGRLAGICGAEYGLQAAAAHGALLAGEAGARPGHLAALREVAILVPRLDVAAFGTLIVAAALLLADPTGWVYDFSLTAGDGQILVRGRGGIAVTKPHGRQG